MSSSNDALNRLIAFCLTPRMGSLIAMCLYLTLMAEVVHQSATVPGQKQYHPSAAVFLSELIKMSVSIVLAVLEVRRNRRTAAMNGSSEDEEHLLKRANGPRSDESVQADLAHIWDEVRRPGWQLLALPAFLFTIQSNLGFIAGMNLPAPVFQVLQQLKQWASMALLSLGIAAVQLGSSTSATKGDDVKRDAVLGLTAVLAAALSSGFASTYFERQVKFAPSTPQPSAAPQSPPSLWIKNIHLSAFGMSFGAIVCLLDYHQGWVTDSLASFGLATNPAPGVPTDPADPFFVGFTPFIWVVTFLQALGGILAALTIKYADNIAKTFASACSILLSLIISVIFLSYAPSMQVYVGSTIVVGSILAFNLGPAAASPAKPLPRYETELSETSAVDSRGAIRRGSIPSNGQKQA